MAELLPFQAPIPDAPARSEALDITRSFIVEAPAGSGKTGLLIQRLLKLLASPSVTDPAQVLAITFTRKATHEMRDRVLQQLAAARSNTPATSPFDAETRALALQTLARDQQLNWGLLEHPNRLNISTIDAFCIQIAQSLPILSGAGGQSPVEDASELYAEAARRTLSLLGTDDPPLTTALETLLLHRDGNLAECESLIAGMLHWRDQWGNLIPLTNHQLTDHTLETVTLPRLERALDQAICRALTRLARVMPSHILDRLCALAADMAEAEGYKGNTSPIAICKARNQAPSERAEDLDHWAALAHLLVKPSKPRDWRKSLSGNHIGFEILKYHQAELKQIIAQLEGRTDVFDALCALTNLPPLRYPPEQWHVAKALFRVLSRALVELQFVFAERGECDFTQFSLIARESLRQATALDDLASATGFNLEHLLVDEMQDTSSAQYELIRLLTQRWDGHSQTVFLVGDPKQSIYLFRQARVARFLETLRASRLGDLPLTPLYLTANFRSQANLVTAFNDTFSQIFPPPPLPGEPDTSNAETVPYRPAHATHAAVPGPHLQWHANIIPYSADRTVCAQARTTRKHQSAAEIRTLIEHWRAKPLPESRKSKPWQIAVLVRNRKHLIPIVKAFQQSPAIPYRAVRTEPLAERQEILDLLALTRALLHPADRTAWLALMRTPWCGLTLRDLHLLTGQDDQTLRQTTILDLIAHRGHELSEDGLARLQPFWTVMTAALAQRGRMPLSQWVARTWQAFNAPAYTTPEAHANIARFWELLDDLESRPTPITIARLESRLDGLYAAESTTPNAVDLMTIHHAKGLEWDFVIVPELESSSGRSGQRLLTWIEIESGGDSDVDPDIAHGIIAPVQPKGTKSQALVQWMRSIESEREAAERKRLVYVACTRARQELHLFAAPDRKKDGSLSLKDDSLLKAAWPAAAEHFNNLEDIPEPAILFELAAAAHLTVVPTRTITRIPLKPATPHLAPEMWEQTAPSFPRPEGSYQARAFGNAMHTFLELLAKRIATSTPIQSLVEELPTWTPRITTILRSGGLAPEASTTLLRGLKNTLQDPIGQWLLTPHTEALSEFTLTTASGTIRLDRTFLAGPDPNTTGNTHLWIIDFKTGSHAAKDQAQYLESEREKYAPQLETYARHLAPRGLPIRLALYYPLLPAFLHWSGLDSHEPSAIS